MSLHLYDTARRELREFHPQRAGTASMYVCGATVQGVPHVGHVRSGLDFDVLRRWLAHNGYDVLLVRNVTDIDDKILTKAEAAGRPWWEWAATHERAFAAAYDALGCLPPSVEPRATGHITEMVELIERLVERGHAYAVDGDVYFAVGTWPSYGELSGQRVDEMEQGEGADARGKRDARDFTLWKAAKPGEPSLADAVGPRAPGLAPGVLGDGHALPGPALRHPRRRARPGVPAPRERARPVARRRRRVRRVLAAQRLGDDVGLEDVEVARQHADDPRGARARARRSSCATTSWRRTTARRWSTRSTRSPRPPPRTGASRRSCTACTTASAPSRSGAISDAFAAAMDDDIATPAALAEVHETVRAGNAALDAGDRTAAMAAASAVRAMTGILGLDPVTWGDAAAGGGADDAAHQALGSLVDVAARPAHPGPRRPRLRAGRRPARRAHRGRRRRRGHLRRPHLVTQGRCLNPMAGNSRRPGARRNPGSKKGPTKGSGGKGRKSLEGRGPTPPAEKRPNHKSYRSEGGSTSASAPRRPASRGALRAAPCPDAA